MNLLDFIRLLLRHVKLLIAVPLVMAVTVFLLTRGQPREFESRTSLYTGLVSGYTIESDQGRRIDYMQVNGAFDNLIQLVQSRQTVEQVALGLMTLHLDGRLDVRGVDLDRPGARLVSSKEPAVGKGFDPDILAGPTYARLVAEVEDTDSAVYSLLYRENGPFNVDGLARGLSVRRVGSSDLIELRFTANDPVLARTTLELVSTIVMSRHKTMKEREAGTVLDYFTREATQAQARLTAAVERVREFGTRNRVINYYEQTKYIASQKESIDQQIQEEEMKLAAADSAVRQLEEKIGLTEDILRRNEALLDRRKELAELAFVAVRQEASGKVDPDVRARMESAQDSLAREVVGIHRATYSKEGLAKDELVTRWLSTVIQATETRAGLEVLRLRRDSYQSTYDEFSPLGATLSSLEREVDIAESEYLELLRGLNLARMRRQNIELAASLEVVDAPTLPEHPLPSKAMLLLGLALVVGVTMTVAGVVAAEMLDRTVRTPDRITRLTGLTLGGAVPLMAGAAVETARTLSSSLFKQALRNLRLHLAGEPRDCTVVAIAGSRGSEGKSLVAGRLVHMLREGGADVFYASHSAGSTQGLPLAVDLPDHVYPVDAGFAEVSGLRDLGITEPAERSASRFVFVELPSIIDHELPIGLLRSIDAALFVVRADQVWSEADALALEAFRRAAGSEPLAVLNGVRLDRVEGLVGEVPKKRSRLRRLGKRLAQFNFGS